MTELTVKQTFFEVITRLTKTERSTLYFNVRHVQPNVWWRLETRREETKRATEKQECV